MMLAWFVCAVLCLAEDAGGEESKLFDEDAAPLPGTTFIGGALVVPD